MKRKKATNIQYRVFRKLYSKGTRQHKRRVFLSQVLNDLEIVKGYSPDQIDGIAHDIAKNISFNHFYGLVIEEFDNCCIGYQPGIDQKVDKVTISLVPVSLSLSDFFKRRDYYKVNYYYKGGLLHSSQKKARRF
jgi:hypothetical protein